MLLRWTTSTKVVVEMWRTDTLMPPDTGNLNSSNFREKLAANARQVFGKEAVPNILEDVGLVALAMSSDVPTGQGDAGDEGGKPKTLWDLLRGPSQMDLMIQYAE